MHTFSRTRLAVAAGLALGALGLAAPATHAQTTTSGTSGTSGTTAPTTANRTIQLRYCWNTSTFSPRCPLATLTLDANGAIGPNNGMPGSSWTETPTTLTIDFVNPSPTVRRTTYTGARTTAVGTCWAGTAAADNATLGQLSGVWQGCLV